MYLFNTKDPPSVWAGSNPFLSGYTLLVSRPSLLPPSYSLLLPRPPTATERLTLKRLHPHSLPGLTEKYNLNYITFLVHVAMYGYFWPCKGLFLRFWAYLNEPCSPLASVLFSKLWWSNLYQAICFYL